MKDEKKKLEPPLHIDLPFEEALTRFAHTNPAEVEPPAGKGRKVPKKAKKLAKVASATPVARKQIG